MFLAHLFQNLDALFKVSLEESGVLTSCNIVTFEPDINVSIEVSIDTVFDTVQKEGVVYLDGVWLTVSGGIQVKLICPI